MRPILRTIVAGALLAPGVLHLSAGSAAAQACEFGANRQLADTSASCPPLYVPYTTPPGSPGAQAADLAINSALGALTAVVRAGLAGRRLWPAVRDGVLGGALGYAGKRVIGTGVPALGLAGREVAALGASVVGNAADGRAALAGAVFPLGPVQLYLGRPPAASWRSGLVHLKVNLAGSIALAYMAARPGARLDLHASVLAGAAVFDGVRNLGANHLAQNIAGVIAVAPSDVGDRGAMAHELVHLTQWDFTFAAWSEPAERALVRHVPGGAFIQRHVDLGLEAPLWALGEAIVPYNDAPWEREAEVMTENPWP